MNQSLFNSFHQLNLEEALNRLEYWTNSIGNPQAPSALRILVKLLKREKGNYC